MTSTVTTAAPLDAGWIRAVLFERAIQGWADFGSTPVDRLATSQVFAEQLTGAYLAWKWMQGIRGEDVETPPSPEIAVPEPLAICIASQTWTEFNVGLLVATRAQALMFAGFLAEADSDTRRTFDRTSRDWHGHATLGFLNLKHGETIDREEAQSVLDQLLPACETWLASVGAEPVRQRWREQLVALLPAVGYHGAGL